MRVLLIFLVLASAFAFIGSAFAFTRTAAPYDGGTIPHALSADCTLISADPCAGWIWVFNDVEGAVWGTVMDPADCIGGVPGYGITGVTEVILYSRGSTTPGRINNVAVWGVDAEGCRTWLCFETGPVTMVHCVSGDRWTTIPMRGVTNADPFAVTVTWGPQSGGVSNPQLATDNGIADLYCMRNPSLPGVFPGCATSTSDCTFWSLPRQRTFIYVTDVNGDGSLEDICAMYGTPYPLAFPYLYPYGYAPNNLLMSVGVGDTGPSAWTHVQPRDVEPSSWGHVKALFE